MDLSPFPFFPFLFRSFRFPEMYAVVHENYRQVLVRRFPYTVSYEYTSNTVTVYSVFHTSRDPQK